MPAPRQPDGGTGLIPLNLFPNQGKGYGHGVTRIGLDGTLPEGYERTINMDASQGGVLAPSFESVLVGGGNNTGVRIAYGAAWRTSAGVPFVIFAYGVNARSATASIITNGAVAGETVAGTNAAGIFNDGTFHDNAGTALFYAARVTSLADSTATLLHRRTQDGTWTEDADVTAKLIVSAAGALWRATNDYQISKCPAGSDAFTLGSWGSAIQVGTNGSKINSLGAIGAAPIAGKEDGIWQYNEADGRFENAFPVARNVENFRFMRPDGEGGLYTATADGALVRIRRFGAITVSYPLRGKTPGRDTPSGPIIDVAVYGDRLYVAMGGAYRAFQSSGIKVLKTTDNFGTFTDYSASVLDQSYATTADISLLDTLANGDALLVGFDDQFLGVEFIMASVNEVASVFPAMSADYSTGAGTWQSTEICDGTGAWGVSGVVALTEKTTALSGWVKATYNGFSKYWMRYTTSVALDAATTIASVSPIPKRTAPDFTTSVVAVQQSEAWEASGMNCKLFSVRETPDGLVWDDVRTFRATPMRYGLLALSELATPNAPASGLVFTNPTSVSISPMVSRQADYPRTSRDDGVAGSNNVPPVYYPSAVDLDDVYELVYVEVWGRNLTREVDSIQFAYRWGDTQAWAMSEKIYENYALFSFGDNAGSVLHTAVQLLDGAITDPVGPSITAIRAWLRPAALPPSPQDARTVPEVG